MNLLHRLIFPTILIVIPAFCCINANARSEYWEQRVSLFDELPLSSNDIVFLGNSITDGGEFAELLGNPNVKNRGISGDIISGVRERLGQVVKYTPKKIFLLIGINDISHNIPAAKLAVLYKDLIKEISGKSHTTKIYIQSLTPINNDFGRYKNLKGKENEVAEFNRLIKKIADDNGITFIDLFSLLADKDGKLPEEYTNDGLHLSGKGYRVWANYIKRFVEE